MNSVDREAQFDQWCKLCTHKDVPENCDPCCDCLDYGYNQESRRPVNWSDNLANIREWLWDTFNFKTGKIKRIKSVE